MAKHCVVCVCTSWRFPIHSYFIAKGLRALRPGGVLAVVVTHALMDKRGTAERAWLAERAHLRRAERRFPRERRHRRLHRPALSPKGCAKKKPRRSGASC
jgi:hypothetical protein